MMGFLTNLLSRWVDRSLQRQVRELRAELESERARSSVLKAELETMAAVIARDRARVEAETAAYHRQRSDAEGIPDDDRDRKRPGQFAA